MWSKTHNTETFEGRLCSIYLKLPLHFTLSYYGNRKFPEMTLNMYRTKRFENAEDNKLNLDFKLSPCTECCMLSFG